MTPFDWSALRADFPIVKRGIYVNHAAVGPICAATSAAMARWNRLHLERMDEAGTQLQQRTAATRDLAARLVGGAPQRIAFVQNTSHGISLIANGLAWRPGDNVVVPAEEFPSNYLAWARLADQGVELRPLASHDGRLTLEGLAPLVDERTRVVALSQVRFLNGFRCDLAAFGALCRQAGALFVVDGTQSAGAVTVDTGAAQIDALVVSAHKWMLGPLGIGFMALSEAAMEALSVSVVGWLSVKEPFAFRRELDLLADARRFEPGTENAAGIFGLHARLSAIDDLGPARIEARILDLTERLADAVEAKGYRVTSPCGPGERSGILTFLHPRIASDAALERLADRSIHGSQRGGALRISPHYYNSEEEIDAVAAALPG